MREDVPFAYLLLKGSCLLAHLRPPSGRRHNAEQDLDTGIYGEAACCS